jgi:glycosyltransferase involved in cell wall biosynthesis
MKKSNYSFRLCLIVHNRFEYAKIALNSLLNQSYSNYEIYVSDNSDKETFGNYIEKNINSNINLKYTFRKIQLNAIEHINTVMNESQYYDFILIFHDDDILHQSYLENIVKLKEINDNNLSAIAINGLVIKNNTITNRKITHYKNNRKVFSKKDLVDSYFCYDSKGAPPFPGYLYRTSAIKNIKLQIQHGGKHSDLIFISDILDNGYILWLKEPLMYYRIHETNDSKIYSDEDRNKLFSYLSNKQLFSKSALSDYKLMILKEKYNNNLISKFKYNVNLIIYTLNIILNLRLYRILTSKINKVFNV